MFSFSKYSLKMWRSWSCWVRQIYYVEEWRDFGCFVQDLLQLAFVGVEPDALVVHLLL
jgi:hypothetical protein